MHPPAPATRPHRPGRNHTERRRPRPRGPRRGRALHARLREHDLDPGSCTQAELDVWLISRTPARRLLPVFLAWAKQQHHLPVALTVPPTPTWQLGAVQPADQRWQLARKLLHDDTLPAADRVAGLLVLLYGQTLTRISRLRRTDLDIATDASSGSMHLRLGADAIEIGEPLTTLLKGLPVLISTGAARGLAGDDPWLFLG